MIIYAHEAIFMAEQEGMGQGRNFMKTTILRTK